VRSPIIAGNWKMYNTTAAARALASQVADEVAPHAGRVQVLLAPPFTALAAVADTVRGSAVGVSAQDMHWADEGAFTGAVSPAMVAELASHVILGHSERRHVFGESDADVSRKVHAAFAHLLTPIVCVGETLEQRQEGRTDDLVRTQLLTAVEGIAPEEAPQLVVAYEPVWAIGTGLPCEPDEAARVSGAIRLWLADAFGAGTARHVRILYGGSVKPDNLAPYMAAPDIDGALVGGASLNAASFVPLVEIAAGAKS
jgi:triosephosphate isomerase (TIM)